MIRCPVTKSDLSSASESMVAKVNELIKNRTLVNQVGQTVESEIESGFVNEDQSLLLPVRGGIVILISDQAIPMNQLA
jgi:uncharacterized protein YbaR (Trm112 family)